MGSIHNSSGACHTVYVMLPSNLIEMLPDMYTMETYNSFSNNLAGPRSAIGRAPDS